MNTHPSHSLEKTIPLNTIIGNLKWNNKDQKLEQVKSSNYVRWYLLPKKYTNNNGKLFYIFINRYTRKLEYAFSGKPLQRACFLQHKAIAEQLSQPKNNQTRITPYITKENIKKTIQDIPKFEQLLDKLDNIDLEKSSVSKKNIKNPSFTWYYTYTNTKGIEYLIQAKKWEIIHIESRDGSFISPQQKGAILRAVNSTRYNRFSWITEYNNPETREKYSKETYKSKLTLDEVISKSKKNIWEILEWYGLAVYSWDTKNIIEETVYNVDDQINQTNHNKDKSTKFSDLKSLEHILSEELKNFIDYNSNYKPTGIQLTSAQNVFVVFSERTNTSATEIWKLLNNSNMTWLIFQSIENNLKKELTNDTKYLNLLIQLLWKVKEVFDWYLLPEKPAEELTETDKSAMIDEIKKIHIMINKKRTYH